MSCFFDDISRRDGKSHEGTELGSPITSEDDGPLPVAPISASAPIVPPEAEPVSPTGLETDTLTPNNLPSGSPVTPPSNSLPDRLSTEQISPDAESRSSSRMGCNGTADTILLLSPHTPPLPPKAYEKYDGGKRKNQEDDDDRRHKRKKRSRKDSESPK